MKLLRTAAICLTFLFLLFSSMNFSAAESSGSALKKKGELCFENEDGFFVHLSYRELGSHNYIASGRQTGPDGHVYPVYGSMQIVEDRIIALLKSSFIDEGLIMETAAHYEGDAATLTGSYDVVAYHCFASVPPEYNCGVSYVGHFASNPVPCP